MYAGTMSWTNETPQDLATTAVGLALTVPTKLTNCPVRLSGLWLFINTIVSATELIVRITRDSAGDECVVPAYTATISTGLTTGAKGTVVIDYAGQLILPVSSLYVFVGTDAGTAKLSEIKLTAWE